MRKFYLFLIFLITLRNVQGQLLFSTLKPADGLASRETRAVFRDSEGYLWVGTTGGLNRFDGAHFKVWNKNNPGYPTALGEIVTSIIEHKRKIYIGTTEGLGVLDKTSGTIEQVVIKAAAGKPHTITDLEHDNAGRLWVATDNGLFVDNGSGLIPVSTLYPAAKTLDSVYIYHGAFVFDSSRSSFWIGTYKHGSFCLDVKKGALYSAANNPTGNPFLSKDVILSVALDKDQNLWYGNASTERLCFYNLATKAFTAIDKMNGNPDWDFADGIPSLLCDGEGRLWVSTWSYTSYVRYPNGTFEQLTYNPNHPYSIGYGLFYDAYIDDYGNLWLATLNGLSKLAKGSFVQTIVQAPSYKYFLPISFANVNTVQPDGEDWWVGKMDGLFHYNTAAKTFQRFLPSAEAGANDIYDAQVGAREVWCATNRGLKVFDKESNAFHLLQHTADTGDFIGYISCLQKDDEEQLWSCQWKKALCRYNPQTATCVHFTTEPAVKQTRCIYEASNKTFWMGTTAGVRMWNATTSRFTVAAPFLNETVAAIAEDGQQNIWLATTNHGLLKCRPDGTVADSINRTHGLPSNWIIDLVIDRAGRLWIISPEGLFTISPSTKIISKVTIPVTYSFNDHWHRLLKKGDLIYASMLDNVVVINTARYQVLPAKKPPLISSFSVFGNETLLAPGVELSYKQNFFSFDFASPFHAETSAMQYAYKLQGFDKDWVYCGRNLTASYTNVPDGHYTFLVKSTGANGEWMKETTSVNIVINPPFWKTWWFIGLVAIGVAVAIYYLYRFRQKQKQEKQMEETIDYFANSNYSDTSINEICSDIARNCTTQLKLEDCVVYLVDEKQNLLVRKAGYGFSTAKNPDGSNAAGIELGKGIVGTAASTGKAVMSKDTTRDNRYIVGDEQRASELAVPIMHEGKTIGVIDSEHSRRNFFTDDHVKVLTTIAAISAGKIAEANADEAAKESAIQLLEIKKLYAESQLMALRAQMNPHFVFNCLNSIQECIVTQKYGEASLYLNKFAKLFRSVLNNSGKTFVTLAEEIEVLDLYLTLEHMRFEKSFTYKIDVKEELEAEEILVPSMLLQPYVENALWHGLMHKEGDRRLSIAFNKKGEDVFVCVIDDNGIGRKKALELKEQQSKTKRHVSRGMTISKDRVELLQKQGQHAELTIIDKHDEEGMATGTKVVIELSAYLQ